MEKELVILTELLMEQLLKLDTIEADGEAKVQRRIEACDYLCSAYYIFSVIKTTSIDSRSAS